MSNKVLRVQLAALPFPTGSVAAVVLLDPTAGRECVT